MKKILFRISELLIPRKKFFPPSDLSIALCGDFMLDRRIEPYLARFGMQYPFRNLMPLLENYDIRALNLETPISDEIGEKWAGKKFNFCGNPYLARMLARAGFGFASLANNHIFDYGESAANDTIGHLAEWGIGSAGLRSQPQPVIIEKANYKIAFFSFMECADAPAEWSEFVETFGNDSLEKIRAAKADIKIVAMHWGRELKRQPDARQRELAQKLIDAGADVVWGHHPHIIQPAERHKGGVIFYSLGNFIFSHLTPSITRGMIVGLHFSDGKISRINRHIINNDNYLVRYAPKLA